MAGVERIREYIYAGDAFQVVLSQRFRTPVDVSSFTVYRGLRAVNPSPDMYYIAFDDFALCGSSPEPLVTVQRRPRRDAADRRHAQRGATRPRTAVSSPTCAPTPRSAPSTSCSSIWAATTSAGSARRQRRGRRLHGHGAVLARHPHGLERQRHPERTTVPGSGGPRERKGAATRHARRSGAPAAPCLTPFGPFVGQQQEQFGLATRG